MNTPMEEAAVSSLLFDARQAYLAPLVKKHNDGQAILMDDLSSSLEAATLILKRNPSDSSAAVSEPKMLNETAGDFIKIDRLTEEKPMTLETTTAIPWLPVERLRDGCNTESERLCRIMRLASYWKRRNTGTLRGTGTEANA